MLALLPIQGLLALGALYLLYAIIQECFSPLRTIPGPFAARFTNLWYFWRVSKGDFHLQNIALHRQYGPVVRLGPNYVSFDDPSAMKPVYGIGSRFAKSDWYQGFRAPGITNIFAEQDMKRHADERKQFQHVYSLSSLVLYESFVDECADMLVQRLRERAAEASTTGSSRPRAVDMAHWFQAYAFDVIAYLTFGGRFGFLDAGEDIRGMMSQLHQVVWYSTLAGIFPRIHALIFYPSARLGLFGAGGRVTMMEFVKRRLAVREVERKSVNTFKDKEQAGQAARPKDLLDKLWDRHDEHPEKTTKQHLFMLGMSNITAGSDTTSSTLSGLLYHLLTHPVAMAKLKDEIAVRMADKQQQSAPLSFQECQTMPYLDAAIKETLRVHVVAGLPFWRVVPEGGIEISGHLLPAGTNIGVNTWVAHRSQDVWGADAYEFRPERWLEAQAEATAGNKERLQRMEGYYFPFGLGARTCIGRHISMLETATLVPRLLQEFEFELVEPDKELKRENFWFVLAKDLWVRVYAK